MTFRIFKPDGSLAEELATVHIACWQETYHAIVPAKVLQATNLEQHITKWQGILADPDRIIYAASTAENVVAGFVGAGSSTEVLWDGMDGHIRALYILEAHHRQGLGRRLLGAAAHEWLARGGHSLTLGVLAENHQARRFYETLGAKLVRTGTYEWEGCQLDDAIYVFENLPELATKA